MVERNFFLKSSCLISGCRLCFLQRRKKMSKRTEPYVFVMLFGETSKAFAFFKDLRAVDTLNTRLDTSLIF